MQPQKALDVDAGQSKPQRDSHERRQNQLAACIRCRQRKIRHTRWQAVRRQHGEIERQRQEINDSLSWLRLQPLHTVQHWLSSLVDAQEPSRALCEFVASQRAQYTPIRYSAVQSAFAASPILASPLALDLSLQCPNAYPALTVEDCVLSDKVRIEILPISSNDWRSALPDAERKLLALIKVGFWTAVPIPNDLAASLLWGYLHVEHPIYAFVDFDLFFCDLLAFRSQFCSPLLVNAMLHWTSITYSAQHPEARLFTEGFRAGFDMLLQAEASPSTPITIAALTIMGISSILRGLDKAAKNYMQLAVRMAEQLHLFGSQRQSLEEFGSMSYEEQSMLRHVAWGAFNFSVVYTLHFHDLESGTSTKFPPLLPVPDVSSVYTASPTSGPAGERHSASFAAFCKFWTIAHSLAAVYYVSPVPIHQHVPLSFAESIFHRLLRWAQDLPAALTRHNHMSHNVAEMHICYHSTIMDLFRPFLAQKQLLTSFSAAPQRPEEIFVLSFNHLRALTRHYYISYPPAAQLTISWIHGPLYINSAISQYEREETRKASLLGYMRTFSNLLASHPIVDTFVKGLYALSVVAGVLSVAEAQEHRNSLTTTRLRDRSLPVLKTSVVLDQETALRDVRAADGSSLAQKYDEMTLFNDYVVLDGE